MKENKARKTTTVRVLNVVGLVLCLLLLPVVVVNMTMFIQSLIQPDMPPSFMGYTPLIVTSGSMSPTFDTSDLVVVKAPENAASLEEGTVICYQAGSTLITHRIVGLETSDDQSVMYITQGDANNTPDTVRVDPEQVVGVYFTHFRGLGGFAMFMQTPLGMISFVILPLLALFVSFHFIDRRKYQAMLKEEKERSTVVSN